MSRIPGLLLITLTVAFPLRADSITAEGTTYDNVYIVESDAMYYVHFPDTGKVTGIAKSIVPQGALRLTNDGDRKALRERWNASNDLLRGKAVPPAPLAVPAPTAPTPQRQTVPRLYVPAPKGDYVTDGMVPHVKMEGVPLGKALKGILRPMNLDYKVEKDHLWISTPETLRTQSTETPETRVYPLKSAGAETLPKVLLANPGGASQANAGGNFGGATGGFATPGLGGGAIGGGGGGATGFGGGMTGGVGGGAASFSNISQLFSTIDDASVGEPPAVIGMGQVVVQGGENANYAAHNRLRNTQQPSQE